MLAELVTQYAIEILDRTQYVGAAVLMAAESTIVPIPSEAVMPFVGFQVADGKWNLWLALFATSVGSLVGSLISYYMGYFGSRPMVLSVGKYLLLKALGNVLENACGWHYCDGEAPVPVHSGYLQAPRSSPWPAHRLLKNERCAGASDLRPFRRRSTFLTRRSVAVIIKWPC